MRSVDRRRQSTDCPISPYRIALESTVTTAKENDQVETKRIPTDQLQDYFSRFTKHFLLRESTNAIDVEVLAPDWGDQYAAQGAHLFGITYDPKEKAIEFELEAGDHRVPNPKEVWTTEEFDGFIKAIEVVKDDGTREIARVNRLGFTSGS